MKIALNHNQNLSSTLIELIEQFNITEAKLARAINVPRATINRITSGKIVDPRSSTLKLIADYFDISIDQLLGYAPLSFSYTKTANNIIQVPLLTWEQLQLLKGELTAPLVNKNHLEWVYFDCKNNSRTTSMFALAIEGDAMWPYFDDKSIIIIDTELKAQNRSFVVAHIASTKEVILRQLLIDGKSKILNPLNSIFSSIRLDNADKIIGVVAHVKKSF
ncbi:MAG: helix-turn-helix domain-containing protein [Burkholderiales bacterium]|nr:helix-turn-helix domain-containing protein [Burkholderiales bacterium]